MTQETILLGLFEKLCPNKKKIGIYSWALMLANTRKPSNLPLKVKTTALKWHQTKRYVC